MSLELVRDLNGEHRSILKTLGAIGDIGALTMETKALLAETKKLLVAHLGKEEREFYPALRKLAATNKSIDEKLKIMNGEMETISKRALAFIDEYVTGGNPATFASDFASFRNALSMRIQREEFALYSHFLKAER